MICALLKNIHRKKGTKAVEYNDFMLRDRDEQLAHETRQTLAWFRAVARRK
jgi:hypothetical protein